RIYVLSREAHARLIQEQLEKLNAQLEDLTRRQEALMEAGNQVRAQAPEKLADENSAKKLQEQAGDQKDIAAQLERLAKQGAETLREAERNPELSQETLKEWAQNLEAMQQLSQQQMPQASQSLTASQQSKSERAPKLDEALAQEEQVLKKLREMQKQGDSNLDRLMAQNMAMRLRKIARSEKQVAGTFEKILPETVGMKPEEMPERVRGTIATMTSGHENTRKESGQL